MKTAEQKRKDTLNTQKKNPKTAKEGGDGKRREMKLPPTSSANTATRNDAQAKEAVRKREPPAMVESHTIPSQNVTDARPLCSYG